MLPCKHQQSVTRQVKPTIDLLNNLDAWHPDILIQHAIEPNDYKGGLVFRSAIESIRGTYIASSTTSREGLVRDVLDNLLGQGKISGYKHSGSRARYDFEIVIERDPDYFVALEVKGGEGNSINISERPIWAKEFAIWSHLDGAIINQPAHGAHSVVNRLNNEMIRRNKLVDVLFFKDILCGTRTRPCPKYHRDNQKIGLKTAPDVFLFPQRIPTVDDPEPPLHSLETIKLPSLVLQLFNIPVESFDQHIWEVHVKIDKLPNNTLRRFSQIIHKGIVVDESTSRPWRI